MADDPCILGVVAAGVLPAERRAVGDLLLRALAGQAVHQDRTLALAEAASRRGLHGVGEAQLSTGHRGVADVPVVVAHGAPVAVSVDFNPAIGAIRTADQPNGICLKGLG